MNAVCWMRARIWLGAAALFLSMAACNFPVAAGLTPTPDRIPTQVSGPTPTQASIIATYTPAKPAPANTQPAAAPTKTTAKPSGQTVSQVTIYLVAVGDGGASGQPVGCGDSLVAVNRPVTATNQPISAALNELFAIKQQNVGQSGLYNSLWQANLQVQSATVDAQGTATVSLGGQVRMGGECDTPRFKAQIVQTILSAPGVKAANVIINGKPIDQALSLR